MLKFAIIGVRHGHIHDVIKRVKTRGDTQLVGVCEEDAVAREKLNPSELGAPVFDSVARLFDEASCDVVGIGDYYGRRGALAIEALRRGKHVLSDKPLCTRLAEYDQIAALARSGRRCIGMQLDLRDHAVFRTMRALINGGEIGEVHALHFDAQHPLLHGTRPGWYFESGKHGGTINDIGIHAIDALPWLTGQAVAAVNCARNWNARLKTIPHFKDAAQFMLTLANGAGVLGDMSYFAPDSFGYASPFYWQITAWGEEGVIRAGINLPSVMLCKNGAKMAREVEPQGGTAGGYFEDFIAEVSGQPSGRERTTASVLDSTRRTLLIQAAADENRTHVALG